MKLNAQNGQHRNILRGNNSREGNSTQRGKSAGTARKGTRQSPGTDPSPREMLEKKGILKFPQSHKPSPGSGISSALLVTTANGCQQHRSWSGAEEPSEGQGGKDELLSTSWSVPRGSARS